MWVHELMSFLYISSKGYLITLGHFRCYHVQSLWPSQSTKKYDISILLYLCILKSLHYIWKCIFLTLYPKYWVKEISFGSKLPLALSAFKTICSLCVSSVLANCILQKCNIVLEKILKETNKNKNSNKFWSVTTFIIWKWCVGELI